MMYKNELPTPITLVDEATLLQNIHEAQAACTQHGKRLVPMTKTHKSSFIAKLQLEAGASGLLAGTILEAERFCLLSPKEITFAYPFLGRCNLLRMLAVGKQVPITVSIDTLAAAKSYDTFCKEQGVVWPYLLLVDIGLGRFGVPPAEAGAYVSAITEACKNLMFTGIASHPGQVYACTSMEQRDACFREEERLLCAARDAVLNAGFPCTVIASGSTPTLLGEVQSNVINVVRPGNYVFYDVIQTTFGVPEERCALSVLATILSRKSDHQWIMDAGSKCLGLDKGAHGNSAITGYGNIKGYPDLTITSLSEEVGILKSEPALPLAVGDRIEIIPNHSCSTANMISHIALCRGEEVTAAYEVDAREGTGLHTFLPQIR